MFSTPSFILWYQNRGVAQSGSARRSGHRGRLKQEGKLGPGYSQLALRGLYFGLKLTEESLTFLKEILEGLCRLFWGFFHEEMSAV